MGKKLTTQEFIDRATLVHGRVYDYSEVVYVSSHKKVEITCPIHGVFQQSPSNHLAGKGCNICGGSAPVTFQQFVLRADQLHENKYKYDEGSFVNMRDQMKISCELHGDFWQAPHVHLRPCGCNDCAMEQQLVKTKADRKVSFQNSLKQKFGTKINHIDGDYDNIDSELTFHCEYHGEFFSTPRHILYSKFGCADCYEDERLKNTSYFDSDHDFLDWVAAQQRKDDLFIGYTFSLIERNQSIAHLAAKCGIAEHQPYNFTLNRSSSNSLRQCWKCVAERRNIAVKAAYAIKRDEYAARWRKSILEIYGDELDLTKVEYVTAHDPIIVGCKWHGLFETTPDILLNGGCRLCANEDLKGLYSKSYFDKHPERGSLPAELYYLKLQLDGFVFYKVGITKGKTKNRHAMLNTSEALKWKILRIKHCSLEEAWRLENQIQRNHGDSHRTSIPMEQDEIRRIRLGPSECFSVPLSKAMLEYFKND